MPGITPSNPYLTNDLLPPPPRSYRYRQWRERGYQASLQPISSDNEIGVLIGQMGWMGSHAHARGYLWGTAGNMGSLLSEPIDANCLLPREQSPPLHPARSDNRKSVSRAACTDNQIRFKIRRNLQLEHPALNLTIVEVDDDGRHYRMRYGTPPVSVLEQSHVTPPRPTSELFHYLLIFDQLEDYGFNALVHLQPKFLNLISRSGVWQPVPILRILERLRARNPHNL